MIEFKCDNLPYFCNSKVLKGLAIRFPASYATVTSDEFSSKTYYTHFLISTCIDTSKKIDLP